MTELQLKSLKHVNKLLESIDSTPVHMAISKALEENNVSPEVADKVKSAFQKAESLNICKVVEAFDWIEKIIE